MAIQFYDSIDLNRQQLLNVRIQNVANDPASNNVIGQIIFNTSDDTLKQYVDDAGSGSPGWVAVGGGTYELEGVGDTDGTAGVRLTDGTNNYDVIIQGGGSTLVTRTNNILTVTSEIDTSDTTYINMTDTTTGGITTVEASLNAEDGTAVETAVGNGIRYLSKNNKWAEIDSIPGTYEWDVKTFKGDGTAFQTTVASDDVLALNGTESVIANLASDGSLNINVDLNYGGTADYGANYIMIPGDGTISSDDTLPFNLYTPGANPPTTETNIVKKSTFGNIPMDALTLVKTYIDNAVVGGLIYQGGYNANTNSPNLDASPNPNPIKKGWTYTVTDPGLFFDEQVRAGDVLIAESDAPTLLTDWTTVQNNIDLASLTEVGIGNVNASSAIGLDGLSVTYANGTATVGLDIPSLADFPDEPAASGDSLIIYDTSDSTNKEITVANLLSGTSGVTTFAADVTSITAGTPKTVTHDLNSRDVIVQLFDVATKETIYATVDRATVDTVDLTFNATAPTTVRILVQKIG